MADNVQFDTDTQSNAIRRPGVTPGFGQTTSNISGMAGWLIRHGWAKTTGAAQGIMIGFIVVDFVVAFIIIKYFVL